MYKRQAVVKSKRSKAADLAIAFVCLLLIIICLLPMLNILARSLSSTEYILRNQVLLWPKGWNVEAYRLVLTDSKYTWSPVSYTHLDKEGAVQINAFKIEEDAPLAVII